MLTVNSILIYGSNGICKVEDIRTEQLGKDKREYYILRPIYDPRSILYVPTDNELLMKKIRKVLSPKEIYGLIHIMPEKETVWIKDDRERNEKYKAVLEEGDREEIIKIIKTLYVRKEELAASGRKLRSTDEAIMQRAEAMLYDEFALVLNIKREDVLPFILDQIDIEEKREWAKN